MDQFSRAAFATVVLDSSRCPSGRSAISSAELGRDQFTRALTAFSALMSPLRELLDSGSQIAAGAAACALRPGEADPYALAKALQRLSSGFVVPEGVWSELLEADRGKAAAEQFPLSPNMQGFPPRPPAEQEARAAAERKRPSKFIRSVVVRAVGSSPELDDEDVARIVDGVRTTGPGELEALAELAKRGRTLPLVELFWEVGPLVGATAARGIFLHFTDICADHLTVAVRRHPEVLSALIDLWKRSSRSVLPFAGYPASALEPFLQTDVHAAEVYAEWLPHALNGLLPMPQVSATALATPVVRAAAEELVQEVLAYAFDGKLRDGKLSYLAPSTASGVLSRLRSIWLADGATSERLLEWLGCDEAPKVEAALRAFGPADLPIGQQEVVFEWVRRPLGQYDVEERMLQINAILFCADIGRVAEVRGRLLELCAQQDSARFASGAALALDGADDEAIRVVSELAQTWPDPSWGFWYGRQDRVVPALVSTAPEAWASRVAEVGAQAGPHGLALARAVLENLPRHLQVALLRSLVASARPWALPWFMSESMKPTRLLDAALEMVYRSGVAIDEIVEDEVAGGQ